jgi:hypothetical protein
MNTIKYRLCLPWTTKMAYYCILVFKQYRLDGHLGKQVMYYSIGINSGNDSIN